MILGKFSRTMSWEIKLQTNLRLNASVEAEKGLGRVLIQSGVRWYCLTNESTPGVVSNNSGA